MGSRTPEVGRGSRTPEVGRNRWPTNDQEMRCNTEFLRKSPMLSNSIDRHHRKCWTNSKEDRYFRSNVPRHRSMWSDNKDNPTKLERNCCDFKRERSYDRKDSERSLTLASWKTKPGIMDAVTPASIARSSSLKNLSVHASKSPTLLRKELTPDAILFSIAVNNDRLAGEDHEDRMLSDRFRRMLNNDFDSRHLPNQTNKHPNVHKLSGPRNPKTDFVIYI